MSVLVAMIWGGLRFPWESTHVLASLIIGACGLVVFAYEGRDAFSGVPVDGGGHASRCPGAQARHRHADGDLCAIGI